MIAFQSEFISTPVLKKDENIPCATVIKIVISHVTGKILGVKTDKGVIAETDIIEWKPNITISDNAKIDDKIAMKAIEDEESFNIEILGNSVETEKGQKIGEVIDFLIDTKKGRLSSLHVSKNILTVPIDKRIIPASQIIEIRSEVIVVREDTVQNKMLLKNLIDQKKTFKSADLYLA